MAKYPSVTLEENIRCSNVVEGKLVFIFTSKKNGICFSFLIKKENKYNRNKKASTRISFGRSISNNGFTFFILKQRYCFLTHNKNRKWKLYKN